ncbi:sodium/hydrogen exchanger [Salpingoeca rosetta]|uniref:Sodium/hydrogen exchanger n=1 Tax=Salpingoeca rosetta (strain ATCC 50818 / BSB-021) TaxID=946362 RepID=F2UJ02_SALR5|nr:sodium/hydrogen exchanger [Salpingoeca rosetta]EGD76950.1 sodium/hydrogen exchanger [Salpingoeca rosetta]|eukprot:XP_004990790.1 sodium/hydrogen exchanger [Salpingoeca rosetta]
MMTMIRGPRTRTGHRSPWPSATTTLFTLGLIAVCMLLCVLPAPALAKNDTRHAKLVSWKAKHQHQELPPPANGNPSPNHVPTPTVSPDEEETYASQRIFILLVIMAAAIFVVFVLNRMRLHYLPDSIAMIAVGLFAAVVLRVMGSGLERVEAFDPTSFFLFILPPIIFESGAILIFAVVGTVLSAFVVGFGVYWCGSAGWVYKLSITESFAFGSLISAVDPVATLAIFQALDIDRTLYMLVFGESVLNDAVSIVLTRTILQLGHRKAISSAVFFTVIKEFLLASVGSAAIGVVFGLLGALALKHVELRSWPALEFSLFVIFAYLPYALAEALDLSGIMAILFGGITHAHYTRFNLSPRTQVTARQTFRTIAFLGETAVFLYLGLAVMSFDHKFQLPLIVASLVLCLLGRAINIFPLAAWINRARARITTRMQLVMWFSGLRGAIAFALVLHLPGDVFSEETRQVLVTTTLVVILFTILVFGGATVPVLKCLRPGHRAQKIEFGRNQEDDDDVDSDADLGDGYTSKRDNMSLLERYDTSVFQPMFRRKLTAKEVQKAQTELQEITSEWMEQTTTATTAIATPAAIVDATP